MAFQLTDAYLEDLRNALVSGNENVVHELLDDLHPADAAEILNRLEDEEAVAAYKFLDEEIAPEALLLLEEDKREEILKGLSAKEIAEQLIDNMASDDAADVLSALPDERQDEILSHMEDSEQASDIVDLLNYDPDTAGGLMATEMIAVSLNKNVWECVREIRRQAEEVESVYTIYVVDDDDKLVGLLSLKNLLTKPLRTPIRDVYNPDVVSVKTNMPAEEVAQIMDKYDLVVVPVVDQLGRLVGRITVDDVIDVMREEHTEDVQKMAAMEAFDEPYMNMSYWQMIRKRLGWLIILFIGETFTASAMSFFEDQIERAVILSFYIPLIISSGGNTGSQASTLIIRSLSLGEVKVSDWWKIVGKEFRVGLLLGVVLGLFGFLRVAIWSNFIEAHVEHWFLIGLTIGLTLVGVVLWGTLIGSTLPLLLKRLKLDPAVSSTPFVATLVDVTGVLIYFSLSMILLKGVLL